MTKPETKNMLFLITRQAINEHRNNHPGGY